MPLVLTQVYLEPAQKKALAAQAKKGVVCVRASRVATGRVGRNVEVDDDYCRIFPYARKGRYIRLSIGDNGAGMDEATQRRVFEPFFTTKKMGRGTGLGLSTVYGIVKQHNGWINLESRVGKGTTFCAYFPEATGLREEAPALPETALSGRGKETVLFADDEELIRDLGRQVLETSGYTVHLAEDGKAFDGLAADLRTRSQQERKHVFWAIGLTGAIDRETVELFRSKEMLARKERETKGEDTPALIAEERVRLLDRRAQAAAS